jgi:hypothetical protein
MFRNNISFLLSSKSQATQEFQYQLPVIFQISGNSRISAAKVIQNYRSFTSSTSSKHIDLSLKTTQSTNRKLKTK